jgi:hypothetical protein
MEEAGRKGEHSKAGDRCTRLEGRESERNLDWTEIGDLRENKTNQNRGLDGHNATEGAGAHMAAGQDSRSAVAECIYGMRAWHHCKGIVRCARHCLRQRAADMLGEQPSPALLGNRKGNI